MTLRPAVLPSGSAMPAAACAALCGLERTAECFCPSQADMSCPHETDKSASLSDAFHTSAHAAGIADPGDRTALPH